MRSASQWLPSSFSISISVDRIRSVGFTGSTAIGWIIGSLEGKPAGRREVLAANALVDQTGTFVDQRTERETWKERALPR